VPIKIKSKDTTFWRCKTKFHEQGAVYPDDHFTDLDLDILREEPNLIVEDVPQEDDPKIDDPKTSADEDNQEPDLKVVENSDQDNEDQNPAPPAENVAEKSSLTDRVKNFFSKKGNSLDETPGRCQGIKSNGEQCGTSGLPEGELFCRYHENQADLSKE